MVHSVFAFSLVHSKDTRPIPVWKTVVVMLVHVGCMLPVCRCAWVSERPRARMCIRVYVCVYMNMRAWAGEWLVGCRWCSTGRKGNSWDWWCGTAALGATLSEAAQIVIGNGRK